MNATSRPSLSRGGTLLFLIGFVAGAWLLGGIAWAGLEASLFDAGVAGEHLSSLRCSLVITPDESARAWIRLSNPLDRPIQQFVRWRLARRHILLVDEEKVSFSLEPAEKLILQHCCEPSAGVYGGRFVMISAYVSSAYPIPARAGSCGVWVVHIPRLKGVHILILGSLLAVAGMGAGWRLRGRTQASDNGSEGALALMLAFFIIGMGSAWLFRWWVVAGLAELLMLLTLAVWLFQRIDQRWLQVKPPIEK